MQCLILGIRVSIACYPRALPKLNDSPFPKISHISVSIGRVTIVTTYIETEIRTSFNSLQNLNPHKAGRPDGIPACFLKTFQMKFTIASVLTLIFQSSIYTKDLYQMNQD